MEETCHETQHRTTPNPTECASPSPDFGQQETAASWAASSPVIGLGISQYSEEVQLHSKLANGQALPQGRDGAQHLSNNCCMTASFMFAFYMHYKDGDFIADREKMRKLGREAIVMGTSLYFEYVFSHVMELCVPRMLHEFGRMTRNLATPARGGKDSIAQASIAHIKTLVKDMLYVEGALVLGASDRPRFLDTQAIGKEFSPLVDFKNLVNMRLFSQLQPASQSLTFGICQLHEDLQIIPNEQLARLFRRLNLLRALVCQREEDALMRSISDVQTRLEQLQNALDRASSPEKVEQIMREVSQVESRNYELRILMDETNFPEIKLLEAIDKVYSIELSFVAKRIGDLLGKPFQPNSNAREIEGALERLMALAGRSSEPEGIEATWCLLLLRAQGIAASAVHNVPLRSRRLACQTPNAQAIFGRSLQPPWHTVMLLNYSTRDAKAARAKANYMPTFYGFSRPDNEPLVAPLDLEKMLRLMENESSNRASSIATIITVEDKSFVVVQPKSLHDLHGAVPVIFDSHPVGPSMDAVVMSADTRVNLLSILQSHYNLEKRKEVEVKMFCIAKECDGIVSELVIEVERRKRKEIIRQ